MGLVRYDDDEIEKNIDRYITGNAGERIACGQILNYPFSEIEK